MRRYFFIVLFFFVTSFSYAADVYFTPSNECEDRIVAFLDHAKKTVYIAVYSITNTKIGEAIARAHQRGIEVKILTDAAQAFVKGGLALHFKRCGIPIKLHTVHKLMHHKFAVIDGIIVISGSYNWTHAASKRNSENCMFFSSEYDIADVFTHQFMKMWRENDQAKSDQKFAKKMMHQNP